MAFGSEAWDAATQRDNDTARMIAEANRDAMIAEARAKKARFETEAANPQMMSLSALLSGYGQGGANPFAVTAPSQSNRFEAGLSDAESRLRSLLDNPDSINQSAAYKFRVGQGQEALQRSLGAKGLLNSGNRLMELTKYGQDMGSQEYENQFGRLGNLLQGYSGSWLGDKNANTSRFSAEATAWNQAQANADRQRLGLASLAWDMSKPTTTVRSSGMGGMGQAANLGHIAGNTPVDWTDFAAKQKAQRDYLDRY